MKKTLLFTILFAFLLTLPVFAANTEEFAEESIGITDSDCKNLAKNYKQIQKELDKLGVEMDAKEANNSYDYTDAVNDLDKVENILDKYGISGPSRYMKIYQIAFICSIIQLEEGYKADPITYKILQKSGADPVPAFKASIGKSDYEAVKRNYKVLAVAFEIEEPEPVKPSAPTLSTGKTSKSSKSSRSDIDTSIGGIIGGAIGGSKGSAIGKGINKLAEKKGKSSDVLDYFGNDKEEAVKEEPAKKAPANLPDSNVETADFVKALKQNKKDSGYIYTSVDKENAKNYMIEKMKSLMCTISVTIGNIQMTVYLDENEVYVEGVGKIGDIISFESCDSISTTQEFVIITKQLGPIHIYVDKEDPDNSYFTGGNYQKPVKVTARLSWA